MDDLEALRPVSIALDRVEVQFLVTVLESCIEILTALLAMQDGLPGFTPPPFRADAIVNISALARKIAEQAEAE